MNTILMMIFSVLAVLAILAFVTWDDRKSARLRALDEAKSEEKTNKI